MHKSRSIRTVRATQIPCDRRDGRALLRGRPQGFRHGEGRTGNVRIGRAAAACTSSTSTDAISASRGRHSTASSGRRSARCVFATGPVDGCFEGGAPALFGKAAQAVHGLSRARRAAVGGFVRRAGTTGCVGRPVKRSRGSMVFRRDVPHAVFAAAWPLAAMRFGTRQKASRSGFPLGEALSFGRQAAVLYALANFCLA